MGTPLQKKQSEQLEAQLGAENLDLQEVDNLVETSKLSEKVSQTVGENIPTHTQKDNKKDDKKDSSLFDGISGKIAGILGNQKTKKTVKIPSTAIQRTKVEKQLRREQKKLMKKAEKIINSRNFSASKLEEVILEIRHIQEILGELLRAATKKVEELYRRWVLKG